ncbi:MAG: site-specific integrase [Sedimentisphaerales bacterium]|nr:site-specific integrase [Sedimentisphaerales bacterium]
MAVVYKKKYPIPMPAGAEIIERRGKKLARWTNGKGQTRTAELCPDGRIQFVSDCWYIRYRDATGKTQRVSTRCKDRQAAEKVLADTLADIDKVRAGVMSHQELNASNLRDTPIDRHIEDYLAQLALKTTRGRRISPKHISNVRNELARLVKECKLLLLKDIDRQTMQEWLTKQTNTCRSSKDSKPLSARTINMYRAAIIAFCNWCVAEGRLASNPLADLPKIEEGEPARKRRPLTEDEITRLLQAAEERPLKDAMTIQHGPNKGKQLAKVKPQRRKKLIDIGKERALIYKFMILTGLRRGEVASLTVDSFDLKTPCVHVKAKHAKSGRAATLPLRPDLADELREHITKLEKTDRRTFSPQTPLFRLGRNFLRTFNLDLAAADIAKRDAHGRTVDVHSLRHTFATLLARNGVSPSIAQKLMRHSDIRLTMNTYTHLDLADTAGAVAGLPAI